jgi:hypothetical protein
LLFSPFNTGTHQQGRKAYLECGNGIPNYGEVDKRYFPDVLMKVALENALPSELSMHEF